MDTVELNAVVFEQDGLWVAQCLEHDVTARAPSLMLLPKKFLRAIAANVCANEDFGRRGLDGIPPPPRRFRELFDAAAVELRLLGATEPATPFRLGNLRYVEAKAA